LMQAACHPDIDVIMGRYNLFHQNSAAAFRTAKEKGKTVVAIAPLAQALWRRDLFFPKRPADVWYLARAVFKNWPEVKSAQKAKWLHEIEGWSPAALALAFTRLNSDIDVVMTTSTKPSHIEETANVFERPIPAKVAAQLKA
ncbi:MAG: aldo/keto reductase, partial [Pseudomonadota bacterium]